MCKCQRCGDAWILDFIIEFVISARVDLEIFHNCLVIHHPSFSRNENVQCVHLQMNWINQSAITIQFRARATHVDAIANWCWLFARCCTFVQSVVHRNTDLWQQKQQPMTGRSVARPMMKQWQTDGWHNKAKQNLCCMTCIQSLLNGESGACNVCLKRVETSATCKQVSQFNKC